MRTFGKREHCADDGGVPGQKFMRTVLPWLPAREKKKLKNIRPVRAKRINTNYIRYLLGSNDLLQQIDGFLTRSKARGSKPPIEIRIIIRMIETGLFKPVAPHMMIL